MNKEAKEQYMETLRSKYLKANKKEKGQILDEYCRNTGQERKYVSKKFTGKVTTKSKGERKKRKQQYDGFVISILVKIWEIFDYSCGQRLETSIKDELERLRRQSEINCSNKVAEKLKQMSSATIDRRLKHEKEVRKLNKKYSKRNSSFLLSTIPIKTSFDFDRITIGNVQVDFVESCGASASGEYVNNLSVCDIASSWWEGEAVMGKGQRRSLIALDLTRKRMPFDWIEFHPDNGTSLLNYAVCAYAVREEIKFSRSRPYRKNDNCFIEQKNSTHIRQVIGYHRYDTQIEVNCLNDLYRNELRLYKNFFQPVIKLIKKERVGGKVHRKYDKAKTPYKRLMESDQIYSQRKQELKRVYESLNPAQLKRDIDKKLKNLYSIQQKKSDIKNINLSKKFKPSLVSYYMIQK